MKILFIHRSYYPGLSEGGDTVMLYNIATELARMGHEVTVYATNANASSNLSDEYLGEKWIEGVRVFFFNRALNPWIKKRYYAKHFSRHLGLHMAEFDVVHIWHIFTYLSWSATRLANKFKVPYVVSPQANFSPIALRKNRLFKHIYLYFFERKVLLGSGGIQTNTNHDRGWALSSGIPSKLLLPVVTYGLRFESKIKAINEDGLAESPYPYFLFLGRIDRIKGLDFFLSAFSIFKTKCKLRHKFLVVGPFSEDFKVEFVSQIESMGLMSDVDLIGFVSESSKQELLKKSICLVLPSYTESFGLVVLEAMAMRVPVVISDQCNIRSHVDLANCGLVLTHDVNLWAESLIMLCQDQNLRKIMGENGEKYYSKNLTVTNCAEGFLKNYSLVIDKAANIHADAPKSMSLQ